MLHACAGKDERETIAHWQIISCQGDPCCAATGEHFFKRVVNICVFLREHGGVGGGGREQFEGKTKDG